MASGSRVELSVGEWPEYYRPGITKEQTKRASDLLQKNHDQNHIFFHPEGLHNHIAHHLLAVWALNASEDSIQKSFDTNQSYQKPLPPADDSILKELHDPKGFLRNLNPRQNYHTFLTFFRQEIEKTSWQDVLLKYVFAGDERADAILTRMYGGFL
jgi:hypothetical protein